MRYSRSLAAEGANVVNGRRADSARAAPEKIGQSPWVAANVSKGVGSAKWIRQVPGVDILVNNAGIFEPKPFAEITDAGRLPVLAAGQRHERSRCARDSGVLRGTV